MAPRQRSVLLTPVRARPPFAKGVGYRSPAHASAVGGQRATLQTPWAGQHTDTKHKHTTGSMRERDECHSVLGVYPYV